MAIYEIRYEEVNVHYFGIEADSAEEAEKRFVEWRNTSDHVYETMRQGWNMDSNWEVIDRHENNDNEWFDEDDILTDEEYQTF